MRISYIALLCAAFTLSAADGREGGLTVPERFHSDHSGAALNEEKLAVWWTTFGDPQLNELIETALENNRSLTVASARLLEARSRYYAALGQLFPQFSAGFSASRTRASGMSRQGVATGAGMTPGALLPVNEFAASLDASWELDVFGRLRHGARAAFAQAEATREAERDVKVLLLAEVASTYLNLRGLQEEEAVVRRNIATQEETVNLTKTRRDAGVDNDLTVAQAEGQLATTKAALPPLTQAIKECMHRLATLCGETPEAFVGRLSASKPLPSVPVEVPAGLPSDLLLRRPDVRQADRELAASYASLGQARAERLPRFALTASAGRQSLEVEQLTNGNAKFWSLGAGVSIPLFTGGTLAANERAAKAQVEQARASLEQAMLTALEEVENSLTAYTEAKKYLSALREAEAQSSKALSLSRDLYTNGAGSFLNVLEAQRSLLLAQQQAVAAERQVALNLVGLYKALGGGWEMPGSGRYRREDYLKPAELPLPFTEEASKATRDPKWREPEPVKKNPPKPWPYKKEKKADAEEKAPASSKREAAKPKREAEEKPAPRKRRTLFGPRE